MSEGGNVIMEVIRTENAPKAIGPYVQGKVHNGFLFASGQIALDPKTGEVVGTTVEEQTQQVLKNIAGILEAAHTDFDHVIKTTCFLDNMDDFVAFNGVYATAFKEELPARSAVAVEKLPKGVLVEVEVIAAVE
jgi:2-iminobutanoate/2-iminopropanoate deaminase